MAKAKNKGAKGSGNRHLQARVAFLKQASFLLAGRTANAAREEAYQQPTTCNSTEVTSTNADLPLATIYKEATKGNVAQNTFQTSEQDVKEMMLSSQSLRLANHLRAVALKSQIRVSGYL